MFIKKKSLVHLIFFFFSFSSLFAEKEQTQLSKKTQLFTENSLEKLSAFIFYPMIPSKSKMLSDKINHLVENELKKYGKVDALNLVVKTTDGEAFDLSPFDNRAHLIYKINNIVSIDGTEFSIVEASLTLENTIKDKTKKSSFGQIWSRNCFLKGDIKNDLENLTSRSLIFLLQEFMKQYSIANSEKPIFTLYAP